MMFHRTLFTITLLVCFTLSAARLGLHDSPLFKATHQTLRAEAAEGAEKRDDTCKAYSCVQPGGSCTTSETAEKLCIHNSTCIADTCVADPKKGTVDSSCSSDNDCYEPASCINKKCNLGFNPGTPCKIDTQCAYTDAQGVNIVSCTNGRCAGLNKGDRCADSDSCFPPLACGPNNTCITPQNAGSYCSDNDDCVQSLRCINAMCASSLADGTACMLHSDNYCLEASVCTPTNIDGTLAKCVPLFTQAAGAFCSASYMCGEGLACQNGDSGVSTCVKLDTSSSLKDCDLTAANPTSSCNAGETCTCSTKSGKGTCSFTTQLPGNPIGIRKAATDLANCFDQCLRTDVACISSKCGTQYCKFFDLDTRDTYRIAFNLIPSCAKGEMGNVDIDILYGYLSCRVSAAGSVQLSLLLALFALVVGLML